MAKDTSSSKSTGGAAPLYGMGVLGGLVYYIDTSSSFLDGLWGIALAIFWPAVLVYEGLAAFGA
ncbi:MAG: hypothetical protein JWM90_3111 [Thermoleophilia bacterium]|nr:hypothetical protein [Thermoleophilia bacterium]